MSTRHGAERILLSLAIAACGATPSAPLNAAAPLRLRATVSGRGPALAIVGGGLLGTHGFEPYAEALSADHTVVLLQQLAVDYGLADRALPPGYSIETESGALGAALDELGLRGPIDLLGHSSGALICLDFALHHPERIRTLTLSEPPAYFMLSSEERERPDVVAWVNMLESMPTTGDVPERAVDSFVHGVGAVPADRAAREHPKWSDWMTYRRSLRAVRAVIDLDEPASSLAAFTRPLLLVRGEGTASVHVLFNRELEKRFPRAEKIDLPGGHAAITVSTDRMLPALRRFLAAPPSS